MKGFTLLEVLGLHGDPRHCHGGLYSAYTTNVEAIRSATTTREVHQTR